MPCVIIVHEVTNAKLAFVDRHNGLRVWEKGSQRRDQDARYDANLHRQPDQSLLVQFSHFHCILSFFDIFELSEVLVAYYKIRQRKSTTPVQRTAHLLHVVLNSHDLTSVLKLIARFSQLLVQLQFIVKVIGRMVSRLYDSYWGGLGRAQGWLRLR